MPVIKSMEQVENGIQRLLEKNGVEAGNASIVAKALAFADARGTTSHGVNMLPAYLQRIKDKGIVVEAVPEIIKETNTIVILDGKNGFGQTAVDSLTKKLLEKMEGADIVCGSARNINHCGALAYYTSQAAKEGYIAFLFGNANPTVAPFGGREAVFGTNPLSIAIPYKDKPIIVDMASSTVAKAKIYKAAKMGEKIDPSWALDENGNPTDDPNEAVKGVLTTMAGPKGYGIAIAVEALAGVLSGGGITDEVYSVHKGTAQGMNAGVFMVLINPSSFMDSEEYNRRMEKLLHDIKASKPQEGKTIFLPGEIEAGIYEKSMASGIAYDEKVLERLF